jgi:hypothetical protein
MMVRCMSTRTGIEAMSCRIEIKEKICFCSIYFAMRMHDMISKFMIKWSPLPYNLSWKLRNGDNLSRYGLPNMSAWHKPLPFGANERVKLMNWPNNNSATCCSIEDGIHNLGPQFDVGKLSILLPLTLATTTVGKLSGHRRPCLTCNLGNEKHSCNDTVRAWGRMVALDLECAVKMQFALFFSRWISFVVTCTCSSLLHATSK